MNLEKAAGNSSEAGLAGWISSNDVTLFTMVLVVVIALFLQSNLVRRKKENANLQANLTSTNTALDETSEKLQSTAAELDQTGAQLNQTSDQLDATQQALNTTEAKRDELDRNLNAAQGNIAKLNAIIDSLSGEKANLEKDKANLLNEKANLTNQATQLTTERNTLTSEKAALAKDKDALNARLAAVTVDLENKLKVLADVEKQRAEVEKQRAELEKQSTDLGKIVESLKTKMQLKDEDLAKMKAASSEQVSALEEQLTEERGKAEKYLSQLRRAAEMFRGMKAAEKQLQGEVSNLQGELSSAELRHQNELLLKTKVNRELVGLTGPLKRVAILFDASGSMKQQGAAGQDNRWVEAQNIALTWLTHLDVDEVVLIVFSSDVRTFPSDGTFATVRGDAGMEKRNALLAELRRVQPDGWTNTYDALKKAYQYDGLDTIVLLSDGAPTNVNSGTFDAAIARKIYELVQSHKEIPINTIGLGNYFDKDLSTFLRTVARVSGGTFRGR